MTTAPSWDACEPDFTWDGSLRDIYVRDTSVGDWERFLEEVRSGSWSAVYRRNGISAAIPQNVAQIFEDRDASKLLTIDLGGILVNCHFFVPEELECDIDPREINSDERFAALVSFLGRLGSGLNREVTLTPENRPEVVILRYRPDRDEVVCEPAA